MNTEASPLGSLSAAAPADAGEGAPVVAALSLTEEFGGVRLLLSDTRVAFLVVDHARRWAAARLFGVLPDQANLLTLVVVLAAADAAHLRARRLLKVPAVLSAGDSLLEAGAVRELLGSIVGPPARDMPLFGTLLVIAVLGGTAGPVATKSVRGIRISSHRIATRFHHRYGYVVDPGHWRERRARRRSQNGANGRAVT